VTAEIALLLLVLAPVAVLHVLLLRSLVGRQSPQKYQSVQKQPKRSRGLGARMPSERLDLDLLDTQLRTVYEKLPQVDLVEHKVDDVQEHQTLLNCAVVDAIAVLVTRLDLVEALDRRLAALREEGDPDGEGASGRPSDRTNP
jgi:hypothetical protein